MRVFVLLLAFIGLISPTQAMGSDWCRLSHPDGFELQIRKAEVEPIPFAPSELRGGDGMVEVFAFCADRLESPLFKEIRRLQRAGMVVVYGKIESARLDSIRWAPDQRLVAVMKSGAHIAGEQVVSCFKPTGEIVTENSILTFGGGSILHIYPQSSKGFHPPFLLTDIRMRVVRDGVEDGSRLMIFIVMPRGFKCSKVDHWVVETTTEQAALQGP